MIYLLFGISPAFSQDKIITSNDDTLQCKILKLESDFILYKEKDVSEELAIPRFRVKELYYGEQKVSFERNSKVGKYIIFKQPEWRLDIGAGWAYFLEIPTDQFGPGYEEFFKSIRRGRNIYAELAKYPDIRFGGGLEFQYSNFAASNDEVVVYDSTLVLKGIGRVKEDIHLFYLQPKAYYSIFSSTWDLFGI